MATPESSSGTIKIPPEFVKFLCQYGIEDVRFVVVFEGNGEISLFRGPGVRFTQVSPSELRDGISARIKQVTSSAHVKYESSDCDIYQSTKGGQASIWRFCK